MKEYKLFINNEWVDAESGKTFETFTPYGNKPLARLASASKADVDKACKAARDAFESGVWSDLDADSRADFLMKAARILDRRLREFAEAETMDNGKPISESFDVDIPLCVWAFEYFANLSKEIKGDVIPISKSPGVFDYVTYEPCGVVAVISPYNFPLHLLTRTLAPALAAGNTVVCKASSMTPITTSMLGEVFEEAGFPPGVVNIVSGPGSVTGEALAINREIDVIGFTGSETVGRRLMELSAQSEVIKKTVLELGGKGPFIVEPDANLEMALDALVFGFTFNQGEICCASTRLIIHEDIHDLFLEMLAKRLDQIKFGDIMDPETKMGCIINLKQLEIIDEVVKNAVKNGATLYYGGERYMEPPCDQGAFYRPTVLTDVENSMSCYKEEIFGPVLCVVKYKDLDDAIAEANNTDFGLGACIFTENLRNAFWASKKINAGTVWTNMTVASQMPTPFGGNKNSGLGREYGSYGLMEYMKIKNNMWNMTSGFSY